MRERRKEGRREGGMLQLGWVTGVSKETIMRWI